MRESTKLDELRNSELLKSSASNKILSDYYKTYYPIEKDFSLLDSKSVNFESKIKFPNDDLISTDKKSEKSTKLIESNEIKTNNNNDEKKEEQKKEKKDEEIRLSDIKIEKEKMSMNKIFRSRNRTFVEELKRFHFTYTTSL